jgi:hypothetical protein
MRPCTAAPAPALHPTSPWQQPAATAAVRVRTSAQGGNGVGGGDRSTDRAAGGAGVCACVRACVCVCVCVRTRQHSAQPLVFGRIARLSSPSTSVLLRASKVRSCAMFTQVVADWDTTTAYHLGRTVLGHLGVPGTTRRPRPSRALPHCQKPSECLACVSGRPSYMRSRTTVPAPWRGARARARCV